MTYHAIAGTEEPYPSELERWMPARLSRQRDWPGGIGYRDDAKLITGRPLNSGTSSSRPRPRRLG